MGQLPQGSFAIGRVAARKMEAGLKRYRVMLAKDVVVAVAEARPVPVSKLAPKSAMQESLVWLRGRLPTMTRPDPLSPFSREMWK
jgi:hypothetical protein